MDTEFTSQNTSTILEKCGIKIQPAEPYAHEHNGTAEQLNKTLEKRIRAFMFESGFPTSMWAYAAHAACWVYNRTPHSYFDFITLYEMFHLKKPNLTQIKVLDLVAMYTMTR